MPHTKIGSRDQVSPGARIVSTVASRFIPSRVREMPIRMKAKM